MTFSRQLKRVLFGVTASFGAMFVVLGGVLLFTAPKVPPLIASIDKADSVIGSFATDLPPYSFYTARDGQRLAYRYYAGQPGGGVAVVVHGSSGTAIAIHGVARALQAQGFSVYAVDLRGHGLSGPLGDVAYRGQSADDLHDLIAIIEKEHPSEKRLLLGHSLGGSFVLRVAGEPNAADFDAYLALSPFMGANTPMDRPQEGGWTNVSVPRIVILSILNRFGVSVLDHLNVIAFAVPENAPGHRPRFYSFALLQSLSLPRDWKGALVRIHKPVQVMIGAQDELFYADKYRHEIESTNRAIKVTIIADVGHMDMTYDRRALKSEVDTAKSMMRSKI